MSEEIRQKLNELSDLQLGQDVIRLRKQEEIDQVITPEIKVKLAEIDAKYLGESSDLQTKIAELDGFIRKAVLDLGTSIKGSRLHAVWTKGRVSWNADKLEGMITLIPQIAEAKKVGEPTVAIRKVG